MSVLLPALAVLVLLGLLWRHLLREAPRERAIIDLSALGYCEDVREVHCVTCPRHNYHTALMTASGDIACAPCFDRYGEAGARYAPGWEP
jgi:hypothetical protein